MDHGQALAVDLELVDWMLAGFPACGVDYAGAVADQVVDYVLEEAEYAVAGCVDWFVDAAGFDDGDWGGIEFENWVGARGEAGWRFAGGRCFGSRSFHLATSYRVDLSVAKNPK